MNGGNATHESHSLNCVLIKMYGHFPFNYYNGFPLYLRGKIIFRSFFPARVAKSRFAPSANASATFPGKIGYASLLITLLFPTTARKRGARRKIFTSCAWSLLRPSATPRPPPPRLAKTSREVDSKLTAGFVPPHHKIRPREFSLNPPPFGK